MFKMFKSVKNFVSESLQVVKQSWEEGNAAFAVSKEFGEIRAKAIAEAHVELKKQVFAEVKAEAKEKAAGIKAKIVESVVQIKEKTAKAETALSVMEDDIYLSTPIKEGALYPLMSGEEFEDYVRAHGCVKAQLDALFMCSVLLEKALSAIHEKDKDKAARFYQYGKMWEVRAEQCEAFHA